MSKQSPDITIRSNVCTHYFLDTQVITSKYVKDSGTLPSTQYTSEDLVR